MIVSYSDKANVVSDALSRKERVKSRRVRGMILAAQSEAFKQENVLAERLHGLDQQMERKGDESLYFMDRIWVLLVGSVMDEAYASRYLVACSMGKDWESSLTGVELVQETTNKVMLIKENLKAARDCQKSYVGNMLAYLMCFKFKEYLADTNLHVYLEEIKVDKTLRFAEEPVEIIDREVKSLKRSRFPIVKSIGNSQRGHEISEKLSIHICSLSKLSLEVLNEIQNVALSSRGNVKAKYSRLFVDDDVEPTSYISGRDFPKEGILLQLCFEQFGYQSIERDRLIMIEFMVVMGISFWSHFSDNENDDTVPRVGIGDNIPLHDCKINFVGFGIWGHVSVPKG
ncbi:hypothetical protein Tco_0526517 [Tanacetum coccineum]